MKLTKFELEKMDVKEMAAIKAGSGSSTCGPGSSSCTGTDKCNYGGDSCGW